MDTSTPNFWPLALGAAGLLFFVLAASSLFFGKPGKTKRNLGCGFALMAAAVWTLGLWQITDLFSALRLAAGLALLLGVVDALKRDEPSAVRAGAFLIAGILLAGPVVYSLVARAAPTDANRRRGEAVQQAEGVRDQLAQLEGHLEDLRQQRTRVRSDIAALGHASFDELRADPRGLPLLQELAQIDDLIDQTERGVADLRAALAEAEPVDAIPAYEREAVRTVEELAAEEELRDLFENEFPD